jgi:small-conductance mechanosensitive channel
MTTIAAILVVLSAFVAALVAWQRFRLLLCLGLGSVLVGLCGVTLPFILPQDFFVHHPQLQNTPLHPYLSALYGIIALVFGSGILFGLLCRFAIRYFSHNKPNDSATA